MKLLEIWFRGKNVLEEVKDYQLKPGETLTPEQVEFLKQQGHGLSYPEIIASQDKPKEESDE
jgi:hypothetical protein